jgi:hypothetical protein
MKTSVLILFLLPVLCFAQSNKGKTDATVKPSTTDCPTWNNKSKKVSKANYFQYLQTNKPNPQSTATTYPDSKVQSNPVNQKTKKTNQKIESKEKAEKLINTDKEQLPKGGEKAIAGKKSTSSDTEKTTYSEKESSPTSAANDKVVKETASFTKTDSTKAGESTAKQKAESSKLEKKLSRLTRRTTKVRKHSNSKCPSF